MSLNRLVDTAMCQGSDCCGSIIEEGKKLFSSSQYPGFGTLPMGNTGDFQVVKRLEREVNHSHLSSSEAVNSGIMSPHSCMYS